MKIDTQKTVELLIDSIAFGGAGIGRIDLAEIRPDLAAASASPSAPAKKMAVFVEGTVPGDRVLVRIGSDKRNYLIGYIVEFIQQSPLRIQPRCPHFCACAQNPAGQDSRNSAPGKLLCGGCSLQSLSYEDQLKIKEQHVRDAVSRIGGFDAGIVKPIIGCIEPWYYRNKMDFSFTRMFPPNPGLALTPGLSSIPGVSGTSTLSLGLHMRRRHHDVVEVTECFLMEPYIGELVAKVRTHFQQAENTLPEEMELKSLIIRESKNTGETMVNLLADNAGLIQEIKQVHPSELPSFLQDFKQLILDFFAQNKKDLTSLYFTDTLNKKGQSNHSTEYLLHGKPSIKETMRRPDNTELVFHISPQSFFQPNTRQAEILYSQALNAAALTGNEIVFDLYCGAGTIGIFCANKAKKVYGIEISKPAVKNAIQNAKDNHIQNIEFYCGDTQKELDSKLIKIKDNPDLIILDPPRNGLEPGALQNIVQFKAPRLVYISCNPTTQARDLRLFATHGYKLLSIQPVDMFPQTYHIESVAALSL